MVNAKTSNISRSYIYVDSVVNQGIIVLARNKTVASRSINLDDKDLWFSGQSLAQVALERGHQVLDVDLAVGSVHYASVSVRQDGAHETIRVGVIFLGGYGWWWWWG